MLTLLPVSGKLIGDVQSRQDRDFDWVNSRDLGRDLSHPGVYKPRELR